MKNFVVIGCLVFTLFLLQDVSAARTEDDLPDAPEEGDLPLEYEDELDSSTTAPEVTTTTTTPAPQLPGRRRARPLRPVKLGAKAKDPNAKPQEGVPAKPTKRPRPAPSVTTSRPKTTTRSSRSKDSEDVTPGYRRPKFPPRRLPPRTTTTTTVVPPAGEELPVDGEFEEEPIGDEGAVDPAAQR